MGITKREIASELGVSKRTIANYIGKLGLGNHVSRNGNTDILDDFAAAAIADALKNPDSSPTYFSFRGGRILGVLVESDGDVHF